MNIERNPVMIKNVLTLCVSVFLVTAVLGLCFVNEWGISRAFLLAGAVICAAALTLRAIMVEKGKTEVVYVEKPAEPLVPEPEKVSEPAMPEPSESPVSEVKEDEEVKDVEEVKEIEDVEEVKEDELKSLVRALGKNYVKAFEDDLETAEDFELQKDQLMERFFDIALLCMDFVKPDQEDHQKKRTKQLIIRELTKEDILSQLDDIRLSPIYENLSRLLKSRLPDKSFFYSGYKL